MNKHSLFIIACSIALVFTACQKEYINPSAATEVQVIKNVDGMIALANGLQYRYSVGRQAPLYNIVAGSGFTTGELALLNAGNTSEYNLSLGGSTVDGGNSIVANLWEQSHILKANCDILLKNAGNFGDAGIRNGFIAYGSIFKALSFGTLAAFFEKSPITTGESATFSSRADLLKEAISILKSAKTEIDKTPISTAFNSKAINSMDIPNTINALIARYSLMAGDLDGALAAANAVDLSKKSTFIFDDISRNPIFDVALSNVNVFQPLNANLGLPAALAPDANDARVLFYLQSKTPGANNIFRGKGFFTANNSPIPVYLPGEMTLIKAEVFARKNQLTDAKTELDKILTKTAAQDPFGVGAGLPAYAGAVTQADLLREIYRNRCIELYMTGLKLEDSRRFERTGPGTAAAERNRNFYPYPNSERDNNSNTPPDPAN